MHSVSTLRVCALRIHFGPAPLLSCGWPHCFHFGLLCLVVDPEVDNAMQRGCPVVALDLTIVVHSMLWPRNTEAALEVEAIVCACSVTLSAIAARGRRIHVRIMAKEVEAFGHPGHKG